MLKMALTGRIPLISIHTSDTVNVRHVLNAYLEDGEEFHEVIPSKPKVAPQHAFMYCVAPGENEVKWEDWYTLLCDRQQDQVLIVVNPVESSACFFDAGTMQLPREVLIDFLSDIAEKNSVRQLTATLGGLTLKEVGEICKMAMANHDKLTPMTVSRVRRAIMPSEPGLEQVDTDFIHYTPDSKLVDWLQSDGSLFRAGPKVPVAIIPRGALFKGKAGTGKTMAARYLAHTWGVQLYRLDMSATLNKYVGESERNVRAVLDRVSTLAPCVLLIDEIEKLFSMGEDAGTSRRILSTLLWWMQENSSRVFTVITSNDVDSVPVELLRPGRLDEHFELRGLTNIFSKKRFIATELQSLKAPKECVTGVKMTKGMESQAELAHKAHAILRAYILNKRNH